MSVLRVKIAIVCGLLLLTTASCAQAEDIAPGLYLRTTYAFGNLDLSTLYIGEGHKLAFNPRGGVDSFDFDAAAKDKSQKVGTFKVEGNKIAVTWSDGKTESLPIEFDKGAFSAYDGGLVTKADAYKKDQTLTGTYGGSAMTANVSSAISLTFSADGKYTISRLGGIRGTPGNNGIAEKTESGTYKLSGNTLTLSGSDGKTEKHTVLPMNTALDPKKATIADDHIIFDGGNLKREK